MVTAPPSKIPHPGMSSRWLVVVGHLRWVLVSEDWLALESANLVFVIRIPVVVTLTEEEWNRGHYGI